MATLFLPVRILAGEEAQGEVPKDGGQPSPQTEDTYTGPLYGHIVTWDPDIWRYSSSAQPDMDYTYDYIDLSSIDTFGLSHVQHGEVALEDLDDAEANAYDLYLGNYGMTRTDAELLDEWASDEAVGTLFYWLGYDDKPYTYIEYSPTEEDGIWSLTYVQIRASDWDADAMADMLVSIWTDDDPTIRATDAEEIVDAIAVDAE